MKRSWGLLCVLLIVSGLSAQQPVITPETPVDSATLQKWLHSGDPRLITWAADFSRENHDAAVLAEMPEWLEHWPMPPMYADADWQAGKKQEIAKVPILAVLDALIQDNAKVSLSAINTIATAFPGQAAILMARHPLSESRQSLEQWTRAARGTSSQRFLAKVAFLLLAKDPASASGFWSEPEWWQVGFVASTVGSSELKLQILVSADGEIPPLIGGAMCGDSAGRKPSPGWPKVYNYLILENEPDPRQPVVVELNGDRLSLVRYESNGVSEGGCHSSGWLDPNYIWHNLIAYWLGIKPEDMPWQPEMTVGIKWAGKAAYQRKLGEIVESERQTLRGTVASLRKRGLLTDDEASGIAPKIVVTVECKMKPCPLE